MVSGVGIADARLPESWAKHNDRQKEEGASDLKPEDSAHAAKRAHKAADALADSAAGVRGDVAGGLAYSPADWRRGGGCLTLRLASPGRRRFVDALADDSPCDTHADPQSAPDVPRSHSVYDGSSGLWHASLNWTVALGCS